MSASHQAHWHHSVPFSSMPVHASTLHELPVHCS